MHGFLYIDKPEGWTSFDVVNYVRKMVGSIEGRKPRNVKVGHTGTLDPAATGLLILCVGKATKQVPLLIKQDKTYTVEMVLGKTSTTGDKEGVISEQSSDRPSEEDVKIAAQAFVGEIEQTPPIYSAIKVNGKRAYELARAGKEVVLQPRKVMVYSLEVTAYEYPVVKCSVRVGSGTYIRSLVESIGEKLGTGAYTSQLRRTSVADKNIAEALLLKDLTDDVLKKLLEKTDGML